MTDPGGPSSLQIMDAPVPQIIKISMPSPPGHRASRPSEPRASEKVDAGMGNLLVKTHCRGVSSTSKYTSARPQRTQTGGHLAESPSVTGFGLKA